MTNYERYKNEIDNITRMGRMVAVAKITGKITSCNQIACPLCEFFSDDGWNCDEAAIAWADAEYISNIDWTEVAVDMPLIVSDDNIHWYHRHFARYENGEVYAWKDGYTSHTTSETLSWKYIPRQPI